MQRIKRARNCRARIESILLDVNAKRIIGSSWWLPPLETGSWMMDSSTRQDGICGSRLFVFLPLLQRVNPIRVPFLFSAFPIIGPRLVYWSLPETNKICNLNENDRPPIKSLMWVRRYGQFKMQSPLWQILHKAVPDGEMDGYIDAANSRYLIAPASPLPVRWCRTGLSVLR